MKDNTIIDSERQVMRCNHCGDEVPIPLGISEWFLGVMNLFIRVHRQCRPGAAGGLTQFSVPVPPKT